jgi:hypothetical protein
MGFFLEMRWGVKQQRTEKSLGAGAPLVGLWLGLFWDVLGMFLGFGGVWWDE